MNKFKNGILYHGEFEEKLSLIDDKSVDAIITDLPFSQTKNKWDKPKKNKIIEEIRFFINNNDIPQKKFLDNYLKLFNLPFDIFKMWEEFERIIKDDGIIILFAQEMFSAILQTSNPKLYRYKWMWKKGNRSTGFLNAKKMPLKNTEEMLIFYKNLPYYYPQMEQGPPQHSIGKSKGPRDQTNYGNFNYDDSKSGSTEKYPKQIIDIDREHPPIFSTQKPVALIEYLLKTYTKENDMVLDACAGSMTTGVACQNLNRNFILIEKHKDIIEKYAYRLTSDTDK